MQLVKPWETETWPELFCRRPSRGHHGPPVEVGLGERQPQAEGGRPGRWLDLWWGGLGHVHMAAEHLCWGLATVGGEQDGGILGAAGRFREREHEVQGAGLERVWVARVAADTESLQGPVGGGGEMEGIDEQLASGGERRDRPEDRIRSFLRCVVLWRARHHHAAGCLLCRQEGGQVGHEEDHQQPSRARKPIRCCHGHAPCSPHQMACTMLACR
jgi:hypothetical protein